MIRDQSSLIAEYFIESLGGNTAETEAERISRRRTDRPYPRGCKSHLISSPSRTVILEEDARGRTPLSAGSPRDRSEKCLFHVTRGSHILGDPVPSTPNPDACLPDAGWGRKKNPPKKRKRSGRTSPENGASRKNVR